MPASLTYPGVYVEEVSGGVRAIAGVSTSVAAFIGVAADGPIDLATRIFSFADFERQFGGLSASSELSYGVRQFFLNGGSEAWIVRIAKDAIAATADLSNAGGAVTLQLTARNKGKSGNAIRIVVDHATSVPDSTFNLTLSYLPSGGSGQSTIERFPNLSMDSTDPNGRYAVNVINQESRLVRAERPAALPVALATTKGETTSGDLNGIDLSTLIDGSHDSFLISLNGGAPRPIRLAPILLNNSASLLAELNGKVRVAFPENPVPFTISFGSNRLTISSEMQGEHSSVRVLPASTGDVSRRLKLGTLAGGRQTDAVALIRPAEVPARPVLRGGTIANAGAIGGVPTLHHTLRITIDGQTADIRLAPDPDLTGAVAARVTELARRLQLAVRAARPSQPSFAGFTATQESNRLILSPGSRGAGASIQVRAADANDLAGVASLTPATSADLSSAQGVDTTLEDGNELELDLANAYAETVGSRAARSGLFALESVDLFNLLVLPGITDGGILAEAAAYCEERRAFLIADPPQNAAKPSDIESTAAGTDLPKSNHAAVYYPWLTIADPLAGGRPRAVPPSGTVAGVYARTDSTRGVWKAPAGTEASLLGVREVAYLLTDRENGTLNPRGVNCLRLFPVFGAVSWGARTLQGDDQFASEWKYVPVRRLALFLEESLFRGTKWAVFESNDEPLWAQLRLNVGAFMQSLFRRGAFAGQTPREAYFVKCDRETTTQSDVNLGVVNVWVGFAPLKPAEFVVLRFQQLAGSIPT